jgi:hypothetical protein
MHPNITPKLFLHLNVVLNKNMHLNLSLSLRSASFSSTLLKMSAAFSSTLLKGLSTLPLKRKFVITIPLISSVDIQIDMNALNFASTLVNY